MNNSRKSDPITYFFQDGQRRATAGVVTMIKCGLMDTETQNLEKWVPRYMHAIAMAARTIW